MTLCSLCKPPLGCFETPAAPFQREGSPPNPPASVWVQPGTREPLLSGSPPQARGHPACGPITRGGGSPLPEPSLFWCLLHFLRKKQNVSLAPCPVQQYAASSSKITSGDHRSWSRTPRSQPRLAQESSCSHELRYNGKSSLAEECVLTRGASDNPERGKAPALPSALRTCGGQTISPSEPASPPERMLNPGT